MKALIAAAAAVALTSVALPAAAQSASFYGNVGYSFVDADDVNVDLGAIGAKLGARFNPYLGVEGEAAFGVNDDTVTVANVPVKVELQHTVAAYVVGYLPASSSVDLFARVGYGTSKIKASAAGVSASDDESGWNAGLGAQWFFTANDGVRGEYTKYGIDDNGLQANAWTVSYVRKF